MDRIYIVGGGNHAKVVIDIIEQEGRFEIAGIFDRGKPITQTLCGYPYLGDELDGLKARTEEPVNLAIALGENFDRAATFERLYKLSRDFRYPVLTHPKATIAGRTEIGEGSMFMAGSVVNPFTTIGRFCILNTQASIDHDSVLDDFVNVCPGVSTGGGVKLGTYSFVGVGANLRDGVSVGENAQVGVGAAVIDHVEANSCAFGVPAKHVRWRASGEKFMRRLDDAPRHKSPRRYPDSARQAS
jgi:sugar O-acyltransferase (sialic acid O-acetyltransferase NeuD family)